MKNHIIILTFLIPFFGFSQGSQEIFGKWTMICEKSSTIELYRNLSVEFKQVENRLQIIKTWGGKRNYKDTLLIIPGGSANRVEVRNRVFPTNVFMGLSMPAGSVKDVKAVWGRDGNSIILTEKYKIKASQGESSIFATHKFFLSDNKEELTYTISRSTRKKGPEIKYILKRTGSRNAYVMKIKDNWEIEGKLPEQAFLISLQGLANRDGPNLYFIYPESWSFTYTPDVFDFYKNNRNYTFKELRSTVQVLKTFIDNVKGYIVWDKKVRTSLIVAFTFAGLEKAVVVSEELIPLVEEAGLNKLEDFRGKFTGRTDAEIYTWAYDKYWDRCNKDFIVWMGGEHGEIMKPGVADWGIYKQVFFNDLSSKKRDTAEYELASKILSEMNPMTMVMGWHSYKKDKERDHVLLTSSYGYRVEGLHTLPNLSFSSQVPLSPGFKFKNNHQLVADSNYKAEKKVYITCVQTDGIGLGAWTKPGRGEIPYAWELCMNYLWMAPAMLEYFYSQATPNDYFIGALSGPGYLYPKAVPPKLLPSLLKETKRLMDLLDLNTFEIMDYSEGATVEGNTELTKNVVDVYYENIPNAIGFINGYAPAFSFAVKDKRPLISYDYYLAPTRTEEEAVADLEELAKINSKRPYFLLMHIREYSNIKRVKSILGKLSDNFEVVPLDVFLKLAGENPTFQERLLE